MAHADNAQLIQRLFERWNQGDFEPRADEFHEDVVIISPVGGLTFEGHGGIRRWVNDLNRSFDSLKVTLNEIHEVTDHCLVVVGRIEAHGRQTDSDLVADCAWIADFSDGLIIHLRAFPNRVDHALELAGVER